MSGKNQKVDHYLAEGCGRCPLGGTSKCKVHSWPEELRKLRAIVLDCGLMEELKWGVPCYTFEGKNVLLVSAFKEFAALSFFKGSLLSDSDQLLEKPGKNSQESRYMKYTNAEIIEEMESIIKAYVLEAVEVEKAGLEVPFQRNPEPILDEVQRKLDGDPFFRTAFEALTPGRQRGYIIYFSQAKQSRTRVSRIEKCVPKILNGEGLHDRYGYKKNRRVG